MADVKGTQPKPSDLKQSPIVDGAKPVSVSEFEKETGNSLDSQESSSPITEESTEKKEVTAEPEVKGKKEEKKEKKEEPKLSDAYTEDPFKEKKEFNFTSIILVILFFIIIALLAFIAYGYLNLTGSNFNLSDIF